MRARKSEAEGPKEAVMSPGTLAGWVRVKAEESPGPTSYAVVSQSQQVVV